MMLSSTFISITVNYAINNLWQQSYITSEKLKIIQFAGHLFAHMPSNRTVSKAGEKNLKIRQE